jgi:hypothetical protein
MCIGDGMRESAMKLNVFVSVLTAWIHEMYDTMAPRSSDSSVWTSEQELAAPDYVKSKSSRSLPFIAVRIYQVCSYIATDVLTIPDNVYLKIFG